MCSCGLSSPQEIRARSQVFHVAIHYRQQCGGQRPCSQSRHHEINLAHAGGTNSSTSIPTLEELAQAASGLMPARLSEKSEMRDVIRQSHVNAQ